MEAWLALLQKNWGGGSPIFKVQYIKDIVTSLPACLPSFPSYISSSLPSLPFPYAAHVTKLMNVERMEHFYNLQEWWNTLLFPALPKVFI